MAFAAAVALSTAVAAWPKGDVDRGAEVYEKRCLVCHAVTPEYHKDGPSLHGMFDRKAGTAPFYGRYKALRGASFEWNEETLDKWLADPKGFLGKNTKMTLVLTDPQERADVIAYLFEELQ